MINTSNRKMKSKEVVNKKRHLSRYIIFLFAFAFICVTIIYSYNNSNFRRFNTTHIPYYNKFLEQSKQHFIPEEVLDFVKIVNEFNVKPFIIDPNILLNVITLKEKDLLIKRKLLPKHNYETDIQHTHCFSFGIFSDDIKKLRNGLSNITEELFIKHVWFEGIDGSQRHWNKTNDKNVTYHLFYIKFNQCIQISVFYKRNNFLWTGKLPENIVKQIQSSKTNIYFGEYESAFDDFELEKAKTSGVDYYLPKDTAHFISQIKYSKFIECNFDSARNFSYNYNQSIVNSNSMNKKVEEGILALKRFLKELLTPFYISSGTLLGWYRQCGVIPYTSDLDTATFAEYASQQLTDLFKKNKYGLKLTYIYGLVDNGYQYALYTSGTNLRVDFFFTYKEGNNQTYTGHIPSKNRYFRYIYPDFTLCSAELIGLKVLVPCNPIDVVKAEYGKNWFKPKKSWDYSSSAHNIGPDRYWTKDEAKQSYQEI